ncbi:MAG TPA: hypothetical protein VKP58_09975 [Candidatus Acidoferrum sp.]|nr:hypothetical protein [Candidatus Acidoferrum sp.]
MPRSTPIPPPDANALAAGLTQALSQERVVQRFVDSYVVENGRHALQVHATLYRDLLALLQREALLAAVVSLLEQVSAGPATGKKPAPLTHKDRALFRRKFLLALTREKKWNAGDALDFQSDLQIYEDVLSRNAGPRRGRKSFESAHHPFVDRCAFVLDSSFMEKARVAATRALVEIEELVSHIVERSAAPTVEKKA